MLRHRAVASTRTHTVAVRAKSAAAVHFSRRLGVTPGIRAPVRNHQVPRGRISTTCCITDLPSARLSSRSASRCAAMALPSLAPVRVPKASPLDGDALQLSVLSYNVLAPLYVRPIDSRTGGVQAFAAFEWCGEGDELLDFAARWPRMLAEINAAAADIVCLQEVQFEHSDGEFCLPVWLRSLVVEGSGDYIARLPGQSELQEIAERNERVLNCLAPVGNVLLLKRSRLEVLEVQPRVLPGARAATKGATTRVGALVCGAEESALRDVLRPTAVFSVHLDATHEDQRVATITKCLQQARQLGTREVVIAGDMNTEILPGSCVAAMLTRQLTKAQTDDIGCSLTLEASLVRECASALRLGEREPSMQEMQAWKELHAAAATAPQQARIELDRVPTHGTRAAYDHGQTVGPCRSWRLDHILYSSRTLQPAVVWETLEADPDSTAAGLPNCSCPSDHLPIGASFVVRPPEFLGEAEREALRASWAARDRAHALELAALDDVLRAEEERLVASLASSLLGKEGHSSTGIASEGTGTMAKAHQSEGSTKQTKKKIKNAKSKPSPEMIAFLRTKRERLKALKTAHADAIAEAVAQLGELQLDALEDMGLI